MGTPVEPLDAEFEEVEPHPRHLLRSGLADARKVLVDLRAHVDRSIARLDAMERDIPDGD